MIRYLAYDHSFAILRSLKCIDDFYWGIGFPGGMLSVFQSAKDYGRMRLYYQPHKSTNMETDGVHLKSISRTWKHGKKKKGIHSSYPVWKLPEFHFFT